MKQEEWLTSFCKDQVSAMKYPANILQTEIFGKVSK